MAYAVLPYSTFLDYTSYGTTTATNVADAYHLSDIHAVSASDSINVAFILPRANDPTALLNSNWGTRQTTLEQLNDSGTLWTTYGASTSDYANALSILRSASGDHILGPSDSYITSQASRTIWVSLTASQFHDVFNTPLLQGTTPEHETLYFWNGSLSAPTTLPVAGLWFDTSPDFGTAPAVSDMSGGAVANVQQGPLSIGNELGPGGFQPNFLESNAFSSEIAKWFYNFPLSGIAAPTTTIGLIEPTIGDAMPSPSPTFQEAFDLFRRNAGIDSKGNYYVIDHGGQSYPDGNSGERSLDVGVVTSANPASTLGIYVGSGVNGNAHSNVFTTFQSAFWDEVNNPPVVSSSYSIIQQSAPNSPFYYAVQQLFIDAALRNITMVQADNDFGSSWDFANGLANQAINMSSPYLLLVGGTSITTVAAAPMDGSVFSTPSSSESLYALAMAGDLPTLWLLIEGGLTTLPSGVSGPDAAQTTLLESVWNTYALAGTTLSPGLTKAGAGDGGVDTTQQTPWYQKAFGLAPTSSNPGGATGRGAPDVSADAGGNLFYKTPGADMLKLADDDGTSASTPLWATLVSQIDTVFHDQGLPNLGFMNDLLYTAAAIAPASFNDITFGNNVTSFIKGGSIVNDGTTVTLTGYGYHAGPGYDLATGLGTPNGTLLARALTDIAHSQIWFSKSPDMLESNGSDGWTSGADQTLLFQTMSEAGAHVGLANGPDAFGFFSTPSDTFAWTNQLAQQSLQPDFDPNLVILFDKQAQGRVMQSFVHSGADLAVSINSSAAQAIQGTLSSPFGFADFFSSDGDVRVARPVAIAETAGGHNDQIAIVRMRQDGQDNLSLTFYRVDDLSGTINGLHPGDHGYEAALQGRAYQLSSGATSVAGPGYGNYGQADLMHVNAGDLIAMQLTNNTHGNVYSAFVQGNETVNGQPVGHLWNYGLNTWGWEDTYRGGDHDYNDLIVGFDFTSTAGHGWLA
jgi:hypothetical protein